MAAAAAAALFRPASNDQRLSNDQRFRRDNHNDSGVANDDDDVDVSGGNSDCENQNGKRPLSNQTASSSSPSPRSPQMMSKKKPKSEARMRSKCNSDELRFVECVLETKELWDKFHDLETEMIITKTGR